MTAGRPKLPPRRQFILRLDEGKVLELYSLRPELMDAQGSTKYGALNSYFTRLMVEDMERIKAKIRSQAEKKGV